MGQVRRSVLVAGCALAIATLSAGPTFAQDGLYAPRDFGFGDYAGSNVPMIDVPDQEGCVKWCFRDDSPCDPPQYKRADNRCRNVN